MLLGKYHIVIFKEGRSGSRNLRMRGWFGFTACLLVLALIACNVWLWRAWLQARHLDENLDNAQLDIGTDIGSATNRQELAARKMQDFLSRLSESVRLEEVRQQDLLRALRENRDALASMPSIWPVVGFVSSSFGGRSSPFGGGSGQFHKGLDISNRMGTPILAPAQGAVTMAARDGAYGNSVEINHGGGIVTKYGHMQRWVVQPGQWVKRGEIIGYIGMTGRTTGPHLHYEVRLNGVPVNPMRYILE